MSSNCRRSCLTLLILLLTAGCAPPKSKLEQIVERGVLRVATQNGPTTYYIGRDGPTGMEYEMARRFADSLGVGLQIVIARDARHLTALLRERKADLAAAALSEGQLSELSMAAGRSYQRITQQVVYLAGTRLPTSVREIAPDTLHISGTLLATSTLEKLKKRHPGLTWTIHPAIDRDALLDMIEDGQIRYLALPSNAVANVRQTRPELRVALNLTEQEPLAWGFAISHDRSLIEAANAFIERAERTGTVARLLKQFYAPTDTFDYVDSRAFVHRFAERLPLYRPLFERAGRAHGIDWRLLAAISYQESHWDANARSPTGVRGLMMLTRDTARRVGVTDRHDARQSIDGGARYLRELDAKIPDRIAEPDRTWLTLAAYNVGFGHLEDARILTQQQGGDPDRWDDVRERLPLLGKDTWHVQTRHGYARGHEPVQFVHRIRRYYDTLVQLTATAEAAPQVVDASG
jgi:membrane-bound lytic murein transglycosylase F